MYSLIVSENMRHLATKIVTIKGRGKGGWVAAAQPRERVSVWEQELEARAVKILTRQSSVPMIDATVPFCTNCGHMLPNSVLFHAPPTYGSVQSTGLAQRRRSPPVGGSAYGTPRKASAVAVRSKLGRSVPSSAPKRVRAVGLAGAVSAPSDVDVNSSPIVIVIRTAGCGK